MSNVLNDTSRYCAFVGIDWADKKHDITIRENGSDEKEHLIIEHNPKKLDDWLKKLGERFNYQPIAVTIETSKGPLINVLVQYSFLTLFQVNPLSLSQYRKSFRVSSAKDDVGDSDLLCEMAATHLDRLVPIQLDDEQTRELKILSEQRRAIVKQRVRVVTQLQAHLKQYFPVALEVAAEELHSKLACQFLLTFPTLELLQGASDKKLKTFYRDNGCRQQKIINQRVKTIRQTQPLTEDKILIESLAMATKLYAKMLLEIETSIKEHDQKIQQNFLNHPDRSIFESLPGAGPIFAARLASVFGTDRDKFDSASEVQLISGIAPITQKSGNQCLILFRHSCSKFTHQTFVEFAGKSVLYSLWAKAFYQMQVDRGKSYPMAMRALAFRWIRIITRCWKENKPYDELKYLQALQKRKSPVLKYLAEFA